MAEVFSVESEFASPTVCVRTTPTGRRNLVRSAQAHTRNLGWLGAVWGRGVEAEHAPCAVAIEVDAASHGIVAARKVFSERCHRLLRATVGP